MKVFIFLILLLFSTSCLKQPKGVYWCGELPCKNKKEMEQYFKENLIIEVKEFNNNKKSLNKKKNKKIAKKTNKKVFKKNIAKKQKLENKALKKKPKKVINNNKVTSKVNLDKYLDKHDNFETIVEIIVSNNKEKPYPDINDFPED